MNRQGILFIIISVFVCLLFLVSIFVGSNQKSDSINQNSVESLIVSSAKSIASDLKDTSDNQQTTLDQMSILLKKAGSSTDELQKAKCRQLVVVESVGNSANISFFELKDNQWTQNDNLSCKGFVGANGTTKNMREGLRASPIGLYSIGDAFYINNKPQTGLNSFQITENTYWIDDPNSSFYNKRVEGTKNKDWKSAEHMIDYTDAYEYGFVINYNTDAVYNAGSAIFFHISSGPTAGCIGTNRKSTLVYLEALDASNNPYILII